MRKRTPIELLLAKVPPFLARLAKNGEGFAAVPFTRGRMVVISKPEYVATILSHKHNSHFRKGGWAEQQIAKALGTRGLFTTDDEVWWVQLRKQMNPTFQLWAMQSVAQFTLEALEKRMASWVAAPRATANVLSNADQKQEVLVDVFEEFKHIGIEVLMRHLFGATIGDEKIAELARLADPVFKGMAWRVFLPKWLPGAGSYRRAIKRLETKIYQLIDARVQDHKSNPDQDAPDLLWHLIACENPITREDLRDQMFTMLMAGYDSTATVLSEAARRLAQRLAAGSNTIDVLRDELEKATNGQPLQWEHLIKLGKLMDFIHDTLRAYAAFPDYFRRVVKECTLGPHKLAPGTQLIIGLYALHHMPDFDRDEKDRLNNIPFGYGPRKCIGQNMATVMMEIVLGRMLQCYGTWKLADPEDRRTVYAMTERHFNTSMYLSA